MRVMCDAQHGNVVKLEEKTVSDVKKSLVESVGIVNQVSQCNQQASHHTWGEKSMLITHY